MSKTTFRWEVIIGTMNPIEPASSKMVAEDARAEFLTLFLHAEREIFRYIAALVPHHADAEDILQQTALALWERFDDYDRSKPFVPWACRFALNKVRHSIERQRRWQALLSHELVEALLRRREVLSVEFERQFNHLNDCMAQLPESQRSLVEAYYYRRQTVDSLALNVGTTVQAIYKSLQRIRRALQLCVGAAAAREERST